MFIYITWLKIKHDVDPEFLELQIKHYVNPDFLELEIKHCVAGLYNATKTLAFASYFCKMQVKIMYW